MLYDNLSNTKIIISGSSSSDLFRGRESLAGREIEVQIGPLSFNEYLQFKGKNPLTETAKWNCYMQYMDNQLPDLVLTSISKVDYITQIVDKIINMDIVRLYSIKDTKPLDTIFRIICKSPGEIIKLTDLANELNLDWRTVQHYIACLEKSLLIRKIYNYSNNPRKSEKRNIRYYPYYTSLHWYTYPYQIEFGKKAETEVALQLQAEYFWNERTKEIDFIVGNELQIGVEVKMRNYIRQRQIKWLLESKFITKRYVVTLQTSKINGELPQVKFVPLHKIKTIYEEYSDISSGNK